MGKHPQGFLLVTVLLVLLIVMALGSVMLGSSSQDLRFAEREIESLQGEEIARSGISYYLTHGIPPLVNGAPQKLDLFGDKSRTLEIVQDGEWLRFTGTVWNGSKPRARVTLRVPNWDLSHVERVP